MSKPWLPWIGLAFLFAIIAGLIGDAGGHAALSFVFASSAVVALGIAATQVEWL